MHLAAAEGQVEVIRFLLEHSVDPNTHDRWGGTPLADAEFGDHGAIVELLREHNAELGDAQHVASEANVTEQAERYGDTDAVVELLWAASENDLIGLRRCLASGMPVSACDYDERTALHLAAADGCVEAVEYLLAHDHPIHVRDRWGSTPLDEARREGQEAVAEILAAAEKAFHTLTMPTEYEAIAQAASFVKRFAAAHGIAPLIPYRVNAVLEDVLTNLIEAGGDREIEHPLQLELDVVEDSLEVTVSNEGAEFNPLADTEKTDADPEDAHMREVSRKLIHGLSDDASYQRVEDRNVLQLTFGLNSAPFAEIRQLSA